MALTKVTYTDDVTVIEAQNLNDIQDAIKRIDPSDDTGKSIPQNADLDTYITPGLYFCPNSATAATLINSPGLNAGFSLVVLAKSTLYQTQLINSGGYLYFRQRSSNGWSSWYSTALLEINNTFKGVIRVQQANSDTSNTQSLVSVGNNISEGTVGASYGGLQLYGSNDKYIFLRTPSTALGANRTIYLPDASGTIALEAQTGASGNSQYTKFPDGTLMQWGIAGQYASSNRADVAITMPLAFVNSSYSVFANGEIGDDANNYEVLIVIQRNTSQKFTAHIRNVTGNYIRQFNWLAIGRWK